MRNNDKLHNLSLFDEGTTLSTMNKDLYGTKFNDRISNADIISYSNTKPDTNKKLKLTDALDIAQITKDTSTNKTDANISSLPGPNDTGLMD